MPSYTENVHGVWSTFNASVNMCLQLAKYDVMINRNLIDSTIRMNRFWARHACMRVNVLVDEDREVDEYTDLWDAYMRHVR